MNTASEIDIGPLTWVKGEIDLALERASQFLHTLQATPDDVAALKQARAQLHQAHGALAIVGLDGLTQFSDALEALLASVEDGEVAFTAEVSEVATNALQAIRHYLDDLVVGNPDQPLRLFPQYQALLRARKQADASATDLFFPDLTLRPPRREAEPVSISAEELPRYLKSSRMAYQRGLLKWLRQNPEGLAEMRRALESIEATQTQPARRAFWWSAIGLLDALAAGSALAADATLRKLNARIDTQIRKLIEGSTTIAERLLRDVLYHVAVAPVATPHVECVRAAFQLDSQLPSRQDTADTDAKRPTVTLLRDLLSNAKDDWSRFSSGTAASLPRFHQRIEEIALQADKLGDPDFSRLTTSMSGMAGVLRRDPLRQDETVALELATALLLAENAISAYPNVGSDFSSQVEIVVHRLDALIRGESLSDLELPQLDDISRRAQERLLMTQVVREITANLATIEQSLDAFFRSPEQTEGLAALHKPLAQVAGALSILGQEDAVTLLRECEAKIRTFETDGASIPDGAFEDVASKLSALGFFVEQLRHGPSNLDAILNPKRADHTDEEADQSIEAGLDVSKRMTQTLIGALRDNPEDTELRGELKQQLETLREDAQLVADEGLEEQVNTAIAALDDNVAAPVLQDAIASLVETPPALIEPSAEIVRLAAASDDVVDAELLSIFLEEATEVLSTLREAVPSSIAAPDDQEILTTIRRSFHTLKGSGRMVGLMQLGEAAWAVEQVLNNWLQQEADASPALHSMLEDATNLFAQWVSALSESNHTAPDTQALLTACAALQSTQAETPELAPTITAPATETQTEEVTPALIEVSEIETGAEAEVIDPPAPLPAAPLDFSAQLLAEWETAEVETIGNPDTHELSQTDLVAPREEEVVEAAAAPLPESAKVLDFPTPAPVEIGPITLTQALYDTYMGEARAHIAAMQEEFSFGDIPPSPALIRAAHTLGGISATVGIEPVGTLVHCLETVLSRFAQVQQPIPSDGRALVARTIGALDGMIGAVAGKRLPTADTGLEAALDALHPSAATPEDTSSADSLSSPLLSLVNSASSNSATAQSEDDLAVALVEDEVDDQLLPIFLEESVDLMQSVGSVLRNWRERPTDASNAEELKRHLHTFKGGARMAGAMNLGELLHAMESRIEDHPADDSAESLLDTLDSAYDRTANMLGRLRRGEPAIEPAALPAETETDTPSTEVRATVSRTVAAEADNATADNVLRVRAKLVDELVNGSGEIAITRSRIEGEVRTLKTSLLDLTENVIRLRSQLREIEIQAESQMQSRQSLANEQNLQFDPLEFDRFTRFQELTRMMAESVNDVSTIQHNLLRNLDNTDAALVAQARLNRELSQSLMSVRMVPFNSVADRLYRIIRQSAKDTGKRANLDIRGGQTELDRSVLDKMIGPIEHLLRNSIAHGLEDGAERLAAGKPEIGDITATVTQTGNEISIVLADDGAGLNFARIREIGEQRGLLVAGQEADEQALIDLIFTPGFSTAETLTAIAGRGIGMDVVKSEVQNLGGRIEVHSVAGQGARFHIYLPLTLAIAQGVLVRVATRTYIIPAGMVEQVNELKPGVIDSIRSAGHSEWQDRIYPYHYLPHLLGDSEAQPEPARRHWLLLVRAGTQYIALEVDDLVGNQEIVVKNIGPQLARVTGIAGATVLGDGEVALIINPVALSTHQPKVAPAPSIQVQAPRAEVATIPTIMVVDDSLTVRKITGRLLERSGYKVITAKDGIDALEQMTELVPDTMLVDIEMPRMDGFDLTRNVRADNRLKNIPIIMITSRTAEKHRKYAAEIGVNHYLGKPFDEEELLNVIAGFVK